VSGSQRGATSPENVRIHPGSADAGEIEIVEERLVWENHLVRLFDDRVAVAGETPGERREQDQFRLVHAESQVSGVVVVPITHDDRILMIRQFRHPVRMWMRELPRGGRKRGEAARDAAARELREEIGRDAEELHYLGRVVTDSGQLEGCPHLFAARVGPRGSTEREAGEAIDAELSYGYTALREEAERGRIVDGFTLCALVRLAPHFEGDHFRFRAELAAADELEGQD
jgi:ADP-ribose pyrophosphatase